MNCALGPVMSQQQFCSTNARFSKLLPRVLVTKEKASIPKQTFLRLPLVQKESKMFKKMVFIIGNTKQKRLCLIFQ